MNNVAMNLVATMMQSKFSSSYSSSLKGASHESFTNALSNAQKGSYERPIDQRSTIDSQIKNHETLGKAIDKIHHDSVKEKPNENLEKLNPKKEVEAKSEDNEAKVENKDVKEVKETKSKKDIKNEDEDVEKLTQKEQELIDNIAKELNIEPDELVNLLNELQLTILDLFDNNNLKQFMSQALGLNNPMELLVTEGAVDKVQEVMKALESALTSNPEFAKELANATNQNVETGQSEKVNVAEILTTIQNQSTDSNQQQQQQQQQSGSEEKAMMEPGKAVQVASLDSNQASNGFEGMLNQVVTQKTQTIIMNGQIQTIQTEVTAKDVFDQIVTGMKVQVSEAKSSVTMQLQPHNLGKIALNLATENGSLTGHFVAETEAVKEVIEANLSQLKIQLQNQGIDVSELKITVGSSTSFFTGEHEKENASKGNFNNKSNKRTKIGNINDILADKLSEDMMNEKNESIHENSSIELHA